MSNEHQPDERPLPAELAAVERQLAGLAPTAPRIDRDRLMFEAGRAAADAESRAVHLGEGASAARSRQEPSPGQGTLTPTLSHGERGRRGWFWPAATATMTAATVLLAVMLVRQDRQSGAPQLVSVPPDKATVETPAAEPRLERDGDESLMLAQSQEAWPLRGQPTRGYLGARYVALTRGVDALADNWRPAVVRGGGDASPHEPQTSREMLEEMLSNGI